MTELPETVSTSHLADWLGCSARAVRRYAERGVLLPVSRGRFPLRESCQRVVAHLRAPERRTEPDDPTDLLTQRALLAHAQRRKLEREHAEAMAQLLDGQRARAAWAAEKCLVRDALIALPDLVGPQLVAVASLHEVRTLLLDQMRTTLRSLADGAAPAEDAA